MDIGSANGGVFLNNTQSGIVIVDATRNFMVLACALMRFAPQASLLIAL